MTEEEAYEKWCPHVVASHSDPRTGFRRGEGNGKVNRCIGSSCMAWRILYEYRVDNSVNEFDAASTAPHAVGGFCGLAGRP